MFYQDQQNRYRYWVKKANGRTVIKLQITKARLEKIRADAELSRIELLVDFLGCGGGWYEITTNEDNYLDKLFGTKTDGAAVWLRTFNLKMIGEVNANPGQPVVYVKRIDYTQVRRGRPAQDYKLNRLVRRFAHPTQHPAQQRAFA